MRQGFKLGGLQLGYPIYHHNLDAEYHIAVTINPLQLGRAHCIEGNRTTFGGRQVGGNPRLANSDKAETAGDATCTISTVAATAGKQ